MVCTHAAGATHTWPKSHLALPHPHDLIKNYPPKSHQIMPKTMALSSVVTLSSHLRVPWAYKSNRIALHSISNPSRNKCTNLLGCHCDWKKSIPAFLTQMLLTMTRSTPRLAPSLILCRALNLLKTRPKIGRAHV